VADVEWRVGVGQGGGDEKLAGHGQILGPELGWAPRPPASARALGSGRRPLCRSPKHVS
jgi:hypothetical protein